MVPGIETIAYVKDTIFTTTETTVTAAQKVVSVAPTMFCMATGPRAGRRAVRVGDAVVEESALPPSLWHTKANTRGYQSTECYPENSRLPRPPNEGSTHCPGIPDRDAPALW